MVGWVSLKRKEQYNKLFWRIRGEGVRDMMAVMGPFWIHIVRMVFVMGKSSAALLVMLRKMVGV